MDDTDYKDFGFVSEDPSHMHRHFMAAVMDLAGDLPPGTRVLDVGCGNLFTCGEYLKRGCKVVGTDLGIQGIELARRRYPRGRFEVLKADDHIMTSLREEPFDLVVSTEVVEHVYAPRRWAQGCFEALRLGGRMICTTPYHGYFKNLVLSVMNKWDFHANPFWGGGHIKLWSRRTLSRLLTETGFRDLRFRGAGRLPGLWMTMVMSAEKPR